MNIPVKNCSSCGACANVCSHGSIAMQLDKDGFYRPVVDSTKCVKCGLCEKTCPWENEVLNPNGSTKTPKTIAAYALDEEIRMQSSSGGIFTVLAEKILEDGGVVVGVAQLSSTRFGHIVVDNKADLSKLRGSKYVQADVGTIYRDVRSLLKSGRKVLFSGTPCQVAGLYAVLGKMAQSTDLITVDIVCHGVPSVKVFEKYSNELEQTFKSSLERVAFRDKDSGWSSYSLQYQFENGKTFVEGSEQSVYIQLFLKNISQNISCADCRYRKLPRIADITLGDFWGISNFHPEMDDNKGTSVVLFNTECGKSLFHAVISNVAHCMSKLEYAVAGNPCIIRSGGQHRMRADFFKQLDNESLNELARCFLKKESFFSVFFYAFVGKFKRFMHRKSAF
ncbi:Coenzyme F420 hydrogenase/dehydrogenase, beta subunit C-terminal domain [Fibrobacter sp. UBA3629]|uniref:Coenzyme F420 hydrogenase/dehydrogenase, beta subunit C-terminal domain n=1 Tax=Fibrobacter sp. UBA3629 TaxID=1946530 RepID=UPI0025BFFC6C|nr:Coenzyme F420 hydrogenase/dehydrogenase, beta subunit C-terminal domain [Fibrobacter sp. UBA3629]